MSLPDVAFSACACMGPMYGEPHCYCAMKRMGLPLNEPARQQAESNLREAMRKLFGPEPGEDV